MDTDACLEFAAEAYLSASLAFNSRDAQGRLWIRVAGQTTEGHQTTKTGPT